MMLEVPHSPAGRSPAGRQCSSFANSSAHTTGASFAPDLAFSSGPRGSGNPANAARSALSKEAADRALDKIISFFTSDTPRSAAQLKSWVRSKQIHAEVRSSMLEIGWKPDTRVESSETPATDMMAGKLFPAEWFDILNEELLADLIVDSFANTLSDAFVNGAILLFDADNRSGGQCNASPAGASPRTNLTTSSSEPSLHQRGMTIPRPLPTSKTPLATMPPHGDLSGGRRAGGRSAAALAGTSIAGPREGFTQAGLPQNEREAWQRTHYHACQPLQDYRSRIHLTTELQRPKRQVRRQLEGSVPQKKYVWPSTQYNFPDAWDAMTKKTRLTRPNGEIIEEPNPVITVSEDGKSVIPYSLVLHKAFLESQPASLREKAGNLVPIRLTSSIHD